MIHIADEIESRWRNGEDIFITSDIHGYHKNLCVGSSSWPNKEGCRNFANQFDMTTAVVDNINSVVHKDELLIHCGDWAFGGYECELRDRINCENIINLYGNHDKNIRKNKELKSLFRECLDYLEFTLNGVLFSCHHYPSEEWNDINRGGIYLFGHRHTRQNLFRNGRTMDVGLDSNNLMPYNLEDILNKMLTIEPVRLHH